MNGLKTDANGFLIVSSSAAANPEVTLPVLFPFFTANDGAVALYAGDANDFPDGTQARHIDLVDAIGTKNNNIIKYDVLLK